MCSGKLHAVSMASTFRYVFYCAICGERFRAKRANALYCERSCRYRAAYLRRKRRERERRRALAALLETTWPYE